MEYNKGIHILEVNIVSDIIHDDDILGIYVDNELRGIGNILKKQKKIFSFVKVNVKDIGEIISNIKILNFINYSQGYITNIDYTMYNYKLINNSNGIININLNEINSWNYKIYEREPEPKLYNIKDLGILNKISNNRKFYIFIDKVNGTINENDIIAAYVEDELRGIEKVSFSNNKYSCKIFINSYSDLEKISYLYLLNIIDEEHGFVTKFEYSEYDIYLRDEQTVILTLNNDKNCIKKNYDNFLYYRNVKTQILELTAGWNLISFFIDFELESLISNSVILQLKNLTETYISTNLSFLNSLTSISIESGYWLLSETNTTIELSGTTINTISFNISKDWNLISYPFESEISLQSVLDTYNSEILQFKNLTQSYISTNLSFLNSLTTLTSGNGYWLKSNLDFTLTLTSEDEPEPESNLDLESPSVLKIDIDNDVLIKNVISVVTITFSEEVINFSEDNLSLSNVVISSLNTTDNIIWFLEIQPLENITDLSNVITIKPPFQDLSGNININEFSSSNYIVDTVSPLVLNINFTDNILTQNVPTFIDIIFSEIVVNFNENNIILSNSTFVSLNTDDFITYNLEILPNITTTEFTNIVSIDTNYTDQYGNLPEVIFNSNQYKIEGNNSLFDLKDFNLHVVCDNSKTVIFKTKNISLTSIKLKFKNNFSYDNKLNYILFENGWNVIDNSQNGIIFLYSTSDKKLISEDIFSDLFFLTDNNTLIEITDVSIIDIDDTVIDLDKNLIIIN